MKLINMECPNCKSKLDVSEGTQTFKCKYCDAVIYLDDEVVRVEHKIVNNSFESRIDALEALIEDERYQLAKVNAEKMSVDYPRDPRVWLAYIKIQTENFNKSYTPMDKYGDMSVSLEKAFGFYSKYENDSARLNSVKQDYETFCANYKKSQKNFELEMRRNKVEDIIEKVAINIISLIAVVILIGFAFSSNNASYAFLDFLLAGIIIVTTINPKRYKSFLSNPNFRIALAILSIILAVISG